MIQKPIFASLTRSVRFVKPPKKRKDMIDDKTPSPVPKERHTTKDASFHHHQTPSTQ